MCAGRTNLSSERRDLSDLSSRERSRDEGKTSEDTLRKTHSSKIKDKIENALVLCAHPRVEIEPLTPSNERPELTLDPLLTFKEAMNYLRVSRSTLYRLMWSSRLQGHKVGGTWRFSQTALQAYVGLNDGGNAQLVAATAESREET